MLNTPINLVVSICKCCPFIFWLLKEYIDDQLVHTRLPREHKPVAEHLKLPGCYKHLFEPQRNDELIAEIQAYVILDSSYKLDSIETVNNLLYQFHLL